MRAEKLREMQRARPFRPFRVHMSDGRSFEVTHPEVFFVTRHYLMLAYPTGVEVPEDVKQLAMMHITSVDDLSPAST